MSSAVVNRQYVKDPFVEQIIQLTIPDQKVSIMNPDNFISDINRDLEEKKTAMVIFKDIASLREAIEKGFYVPEVQHLYPSRFMSKSEVKKYFSPEDRESLIYIESKRHCQLLPDRSKYQDKTYFSIKRDAAASEYVSSYSTDFLLDGQCFCMKRHISYKKFSFHMKHFTFTESRL